MTSSVGHQVLSSLLVGLVALCTGALLCIQQGMQQTACHVPVHRVSGGVTTHARLIRLDEFSGAQQRGR